jgi:streptogramin lyase
LVTEYALSSRGFFYDSAITVGLDGALWFVTDGNVGRITTAGIVAWYGSSIVAATNTVGPDGAVWFLEPTDLDDDLPPRLERITTSGVITQYDVPTSGFLDVFSVIATGPDGALWFTDDTGIIRATGFSTGSLAQIMLPVNGLR